jgi:hypothetical protein
LGWLPAIGLDEGLRRTIAYFDRVLAAPVGAQIDGGRTAG